MSRLVRNLDAEIDKRSLLKHSFYRMWSEGKLTREHLAGYSKEYFQLVRAVPELVANVDSFVEDGPSKKAVAEMIKEESEHVELWAKFAGSMGVPREELLAYRGTPKTRRAVSKLRSVTKGSFRQGAAAMYSIESEQPRISRTKLDGLVAFYGMGADEEGTVYFREHEVADVRHAAVWRGLLQRKVAPGDEAASVEASAESLAAQNAILDSVMDTYVSPV
jgi:pyrroloquinoline-quinone synthase